MFKLATFFLCALTLGSMAGSQYNGYNSENQCSQTIRSALDPMNAFIRDTSYQLTRIEGEQKATQDTLQALKDEQETQMTAIHTMMDAQLLAVQTELENQSCQKTISPDEFKAELLAVQEKMDHRFQEQTQNHRNLSNQLSAAQATLEKQQTTLQNSLNQIIAQQNMEKSARKSISKEDLEESLNSLRTKMEDQINAIQNSLTALMKKIEDQPRRRTPQTTSPKPPTTKVVLQTQKTYPAETQQIGERLFYIGNNRRQTWTEAAATCQNMGGFLASIKDKTELTAIQAKLQPNNWYWLGISSKNGSFVSSASGKPAGYLNWYYDNVYPTNKCIFLYNGGMFQNDCNTKTRFICQFDNQV